VRTKEAKMEKKLIFNVLKEVYFLSKNDQSYIELSNLNDVLKGFIIEVYKGIKEKNLVMNINIENYVNKNIINASISNKLNDDEIKQE